MEFQPWPKTARLFRDVVITEKIDGTNAAVRIEARDLEGQLDLGFDPESFIGHTTIDGVVYSFGAQSRKRLITPADDNHGFARWVLDNADKLLYDLGPGTHFGEWWGSGIQRRYGLDHRRFSLFNTAKWQHADLTTPGIDVVPVLYEGVFDWIELEGTLTDLERHGSVAAPGFNRPEGVCVFHTQSRRVYKVTLDGDGHKNA
jgi:hypothetical protein